jgi:dephospho-CoA kinase
MLKVGLTGGIACGKSYTLRALKRLGAETIDSDLLARHVVEPGLPAYEQIVQEFGREVLKASGELNRKRLGEIIFTNSESRRRLNEIVHPYILAEEEKRLAALEREEHSPKAPMVVVDAALMIETGSYRKYDFLIVVYCHPGIQLRRLMARDQISEEGALLKIATQLPVIEKIQYADFIVETSGKMSDTDEQVCQVFKELMIRYEEMVS